MQPSQHLLTKEHECKRMAADLCRYQDEGELFSMGDGTWVYEFIPESQRHSVTWKHPHSPTTETFKVEPFVKTAVTMAVTVCRSV
jgi:hypothetical protein